MKNGTMYAAKLKKAWAKHRTTVDKPQVPELQDPVHCLAAAILGVTYSQTHATKLADRLLNELADWNEVRVSSAVELHEVIDATTPDGIARCQRLKQVLQAIYDWENRVSLDRLRSVGRRDARQYLDQLRGIDEFAVASIILWGLGGHAIPINDRLLDALRAAGLVHPAATRVQVQAFLERHVGAAEAKEFCLSMRSFVPPKRDTKRRAKTPTSRARKTKKVAG